MREESTPHRAQHKTRLSVALDAGYESSWLAGLQYVRNIVYTLAALPVEERPAIRVLPVNAETIERVRDLDRFDFVEVASPRGNPRLVEARLLARRVARKYIQPLIGKPLIGAFKGLDVTYPGWGRTIPGTTQVHFVPDLQHVFLPQHFTTAEIRDRARRFGHLAAGENFLIFSSESALEDFRATYPQSRAHAYVWRFVSPMTEEELSGGDPLEKYGLPDRFLYVGNQFWAHKDHLTLFRALVLLREEGMRPRVVCTGALEDRRNPAYVDGLKRFLDEHRLHDQVTILGVVPRRDQIAVLRRAALVVQPSTFEGWSTVVEDAKALGRPLILSDFRVHLEQAPDHTFFELGSAESLAKVLQQRFPDAPSGPDPVAEEQARIAVNSRREDLARLFIEIVAKAASSISAGH